MHISRFSLLAFGLILILLACKDDDDMSSTIGTIVENPDTEESNEDIVPTIIPIGDEKYLTTNSDYIFDQSKLHTFELLIPEDAYQFLNEDPAAEQYVEGSLVFESDTISPVGIRYKGSVGGFVNCVSGSDWANPSGRKTCTKLSMKVKINWEGREEQFFKLKKLQFHSQNLDDSQMHDRLGYWLFREMGVVAPRAVHARLRINGEFAGLFSLVEQIDNRLIKYNFDDDEGNLYKEVWPLTMDGVPHPDQTYINALKTNEDENPSADIVKTFAQAIANTSTSEEAAEIIRQWMDINKIISHLMVDRTIRHDDGPFHWYCGGNDCSNHNYFWYEEPTNKKLHLIPWDLDNAFENIINNANPVTPVADEFGETSNNCQPFFHGLFGLRQWSASCDKLTAGWATFEKEYEQNKTEFINGPFSKAQTDMMIDQWSAQIREATQLADDVHADAISIGQWESALAQLKGQLEHAREN